MGVWNGRHGRGAMRRHNEQKRIEAEIRNEDYQIMQAEVAKADVQRAKEENEVSK